MRENLVVQEFKILIKSWIEDSYVEKINQGPFSHRGIPDLVLVAWGEISMLEVKTTTGVVSELQEDTLTSMAAAGGAVGVLRGTDESYRFELTDYRTGQTFVLDRRDGKDTVISRLWEFLYGSKPQKVPSEYRGDASSSDRANTV